MNERIVDYKIHSIKYQQEDDTCLQHDGHLPGKCDDTCDDKCPADQGPAPACSGQVDLMTRQWRLPIIRNTRRSQTESLCEIGVH